MKASDLKIIRHSPELTEIRIPYGHSDTREFLLASDIHLDNPHCQRDLLKKHLKQAQGRGAHALMFGDVFCMMQGKHDRRGSKGSIRPEHLGGNYFDLVIKECTDWLAPFAKTIVMISDGNHETAIINHNEINPLASLTERLREKHNSQVEHMSYQGWIWFTFHRHNDNAKVRRSTLFFHHGAWGGIISKGVMGGGRYASIAPDADVIVNGHNHERTIVSHPCYRISQSGKQRINQRWHLQTGTYKEEFGSGGGWAVEKIVMPKSLGGLWLKLKPTNEGVEISVEPAV